MRTRAQEAVGLPPRAKYQPLSVSLLSWNGAGACKFLRSPPCLAAAAGRQALRWPAPRPPFSTERRADDRRWTTVDENPLARFVRLVQHLGICNTTGSGDESISRRARHPAAAAAAPRGGGDQRAAGTAAAGPL